MLDSIHVQIINYSVLPENKIKIIKGNNRNILYWIGAKIITGKKGIYNDEFIKVTFSGFYALYVNFSAPKIIRLNNYQLAVKEELPEIFLKVQSYLKEIGIICNIFTAEPCRLDFAKNIEVEEEVFYYIDMIYNFIDKARLNKTKYCSKTTYAQNKQQGICYYDKKGEMISKGIDVSGLPGNVLRIELRLMNKQKIKACLDINSVDELIKYFSHISIWYDYELKKKVFFLDPQHVNKKRKVNREEREELYKEFDNSIRWKSNFKKLNFVRISLKKYSVKELCKRKREKELSKDKHIKKASINSKLTRFRKLVNEAREFFMQFKMVTDNKSSADLYIELKNKLIE